ncbi:efflux transporter outer membrane subunit [Methylococcus sp. EFPC2]|uniref:efflux transporter outer membrane subunit n=1 Tax=Methylococcus sp. EFPC2 TaxID=2812648 RepID=UPI001967B2FC|nr:efflux transporter outer membrane subunit [Methylococcus sp. EFPC2]QSA98646.1 efflux transporter outer membrane subunit [Methylococcus sp. EFPC2]
MTRPGARRACLPLLMLLTACGSSPERRLQDVGVTLPPRWTGVAARSAAVSTEHPPVGKQLESTATSAALSVPEHWLDGFADPSLSALVREALHANLDLKAAAARVEAAREQVAIDGAGRWPQLSFAPGYERTQVRNTGFGSTEFGAFQALFNLDWELDVWGRILASRQATGSEAAAVAADYSAARLSLAARTAQSYFELAEARLQAEVAEQSTHERTILVELVRGRFARGLTRGLDLRLALTDLANAEAQQAQAHNRVQAAARRLEVLLGRYPQAEPGGSMRLPEPPDAISAGLPSQLLERRPDLSAAFERLRASDSRVESAKKALLPRITLTATGGTRSAALTELADPRAAAWNVAMGLLQPVFTGGRLKAEIRLNEARAEEAYNLYKNTALNAFREVEQTLAAEEWLREQEQALREAVEQTEQSRKLAVYSYRHGFIEILTLLDSYRSTLNARSAHLAAKRQLLSNRIDLYLALGGGA